MKGPLDIHQHLLAHDVHHEIVRLRRTALHASSLAEALGIPRRLCVATYPFHAVTNDGDTLVIVVAPADTPIDDAQMCRTLAETLRDKIGRVAVFAPAGCDLVSRRTDYIASHVCPLLLPPDVIVVAHQSLADLTTAIVYTATGDAGTALGLRALDLLVLTRAIVLSTGRRSATRRRPVTINLEAAAPASHLEGVGRRAGRPNGPPAASAASASPTLARPRAGVVRTARAAS